MKQTDLNFWSIPLGMLFAIAVLALMMCGCKSIEYVPVIQTEVHHDSIYFTKVQMDSVYINDSIYIKDRGDTVWIERWHTAWRERVRIDTTYIAKVDSIPMPYEVSKYIDKPLKWWEKSLMWIGILSMALVIFLCAQWVAKIGMR